MKNKNPTELIHLMTVEIIDQLGLDAAKELAQDIIKTCQNNMSVVDEYSDDELFVADLKIKHPDYTVDEFLDKLDAAKADKDFYRKEIIKIRSYYKQIEDSQTTLIEDADKNQITNYLLDVDANGQSQFMKDLSDPTALIDLSIFRTLKISNLTNYWKSVLKNERKKLLSLKRK